MGNNSNLNENAKIVNRKKLANGRTKVTWSNGAVQYVPAPKNSSAKVTLGPGTFFRNNPNKIENALKMLARPNLELNPGYVYNLLKKAGKPGYKNYVIKSNSGIHGFAVISAPRGNALKIEVIATRAGSKLGPAFINKILANARASPFKTVHLNSVPRAVSFYERHGFTRNNANNRPGKTRKMTARLT